MQCMFMTTVIKCNSLNNDILNANMTLFEMSFGTFPLYGMVRTALTLFHCMVWHGSVWLPNFFHIQSVDKTKDCIKLE